jgi:starch synthase
MKILYVTSECAPFCKTGGLGDVSGSLPQALAAEGDDVAVILPLYQSVSAAWRDRMTFVKYIYIDLSWRHIYCGLFRMEREGVTYYFVDNEQYFARPELYGYYDDGERFGYFARAVVSLIPHLGFRPEVVHCNDWQSALCCIYIADEAVRDPALRGIRTVFTVHNIEYQGRFGRETLGDLFGLPEGWFTGGTMAFDGDVNLLKGALMTCDAITTVSPTYAEELRTAYYAHGLEGVMNLCAWKMHGVMNGIDMKRYDPLSDPALAANYSADDLAGKAACKAALQSALALSEQPDAPMIAVISRLVQHKGLDLVCEALPGIMDLGVQLVVLGRGDWHFEEFFRNAQFQYPGRLAARIQYDEALSMRIYSAADMFLMPSLSEPCGLSQMIAMRYGAVPIARETGGLKDSVHPYEAWCGAGNGFTFANYSAADMLYVIRQAVGLYRNESANFAKLRERGMTADFGWNRSAKEYDRIYESILAK